MSVLREVLARFGIEADSGPLEDLDKATDGMVNKLKKLGGLLAEGLAVKELGEWVLSMSEVGDEIAKSSKKLGFSTESLQAWRHAAKLSGVEAGELDGTLTILQRHLADAASGGKEGVAFFAKLGVKVKDAHGNIRPLDDILPDIAEKIKNAKGPTEAAGLAMKAFGRSGTSMLPFLMEGREGVAKLRAEFVELGGGMEDETVKASEELNDEMDRLGLSIFSLKSRIAGVLIPYMRLLVEMAKNVVTGFMKLTEGTHVMEIAMAILGAIMVAFAVKVIIAFAPLIATAAAFAIAIAFIILVVDDLISLFTGGKSVIGDFIDEMFGAGTAAEVVRDLRDAWEGLVLFIKDATHAVKEFLGLETEADGKAASVKEDTDRRVKRVRQGTANRLPGESSEDMFRRVAAPGESWEDARDRIEGRPKRVRHAAVGASGRPGRAVSVPVSGKATGATVDARTTATIQVAPGTPEKQQEDIRKAVGEVMDERNRQTVAALDQEAVED